MEETKSPKMNFFVRVYKSVTSFDTYKKFANEPLSKAIKYLALLVLIFSIIVSTVYIFKFKSNFSRGIQYLSNNIDDLSFSNSIFSYNNNEYTVYDSEDNIIPIIIVDTSDNPDIEAYKDKVKLYNFGCIFLKDRMTIFVSAEDAENGFTTVQYSDYNINNMSKEDIINTLNNPFIYVYFAFAVIIVEFIEYFIYILLNAIVLGVIGQLLATILRLRLRFKETYKMGIYALTLPILLELAYIILNASTGFVIQYFSWMYTTISYIYICVAILIIKTDFINLQKELIRIQMEKENNIDQLEKVPEEETKDEEKDKKNETKDDTDKDNDLKEQTDG